MVDSTPNNLQGIRYKIKSSINEDEALERETGFTSTTLSISDIRNFDCAHLSKLESCLHVLRIVVIVLYDFGYKINRFLLGFNSHNLDQTMMQI